MLMTRHTTLVAAIALCAGAAAPVIAAEAIGIKPAVGTQISGDARPVSLSSAQRASIASAFNWHDRDSGILTTSLVNPSMVFTETVGLKERTNRLNVQVKTEDEMMHQILVEMRLAMDSQQDAGDVQRPAASTNHPVIDFANIRERARQRMVEARNRLDASLIEAFDDVDMHTVHLPEGVSAEAMAELLMQTGDYDFVSIDWLCYPTDTMPNDPLIGNQWYHASGRIDTYGAWDHTQGSGEVIACCDTGVDIDHPDLAAVLEPGFNAVTNLAQVDGGQVNDNINGHGTLTAGCSAAIGDNGTGITGIGWDFGIIPCKVSNNADGTAFLSDILQGARWGSDEGAYASNCSYGGSEDPASASSGSHIRAEGHQLVFSAGNFGLADQVNDWDKVTIVGASNQGDNWASFSNTGVGIDCIAPGVNVYSTTRTGGYGFTTGTSFSSPITAAALMLVHSANPSLSADEVEMTLLNACDDKQAAGEDNQTGWGRINVGRAVEDAIFGPSLVPLPYLDTFSDPALLKWRDLTGAAGVSSDATNEPSGDDSLLLTSGDSARTVGVRASDFASQTGQIVFSTQHKGTESGEDLVVEYYSLLGGTWQPLATIPSDGTDQTEFTKHRLEVPALGFWDDLRLRFTAGGNTADDRWFIDDVEMSFFTGNELPWSDDFEDGQSLAFDWDSTNSTTSTGADNEPSGTMAANLDSTDTMTSKVIDTTGAVADGPAYIRLYTQHKGVEAGETLTVEYLDLLSTWQTLAVIASDGNDQSSFTLHQLELNGFAYHDAFQLRVSAQGDEANDDWYIDDIAVTTELIDDEPECAVDLDMNGTLDFFDLSIFLNMQLDWDGNTSFDFFDLSGYLNEFNAGCP